MARCSSGGCLRHVFTVQWVLICDTGFPAVISCLAGMTRWSTFGGSWIREDCRVAYMVTVSVRACALRAGASPNESSRSLSQPPSRRSSTPAQSVSATDQPDPPPDDGYSSVLIDRSRYLPRCASICSITARPTLRRESPVIGIPRHRNAAVQF